MLMVCVLPLAACSDAETNSGNSANNGGSKTVLPPVEKTQDNLIIAEELKLKGESGGVTIIDMHVHSQAYIAAKADGEKEIARIAYDIFTQENKADLYIHLTRYVTADKSEWNAIHQSMIDEYKAKAEAALAKEKEAEAAREELRKKREAERKQRELERAEAAKLRPYTNVISTTKAFLKMSIHQAYLDTYFDKVKDIKTQAIQRRAYHMWYRENTNMYHKDFKFAQNRRNEAFEKIEEMKALKDMEQSSAIQKLINPYIEKATTELANK